MKENYDSGQIKINADSWLSIIQFPVILLIIGYFHPEHLITMLIAFLPLIYFINNSMTVYYFKENEIIKSHRIIKNKRTVIAYSSVENITVIRQGISLRLNHQIAINLKKSSPKIILPNIYFGGWDKKDYLIDFLTNKQIKIIMK